MLGIMVASKDAKMNKRVVPKGTPNLWSNRKKNTHTYTYGLFRVPWSRHRNIIQFP